MASFLRGKVSKNKIRFQEDSFDLDLTYITPRIIAMGFPSSSTEALYRNPISEVQRFYEKRHKDNYKLYNLCAERTYDASKFHGRVSHYPFEDHNAPPVELIVQCCNDVHQWLSENDNHVVGINCKAGKGRTGLIICCYLMHAKIVENADEAMLYYATRRTKDGKGVTIASQQRYVRYYEKVLKLGKVPEPRLLKLMTLRVHTVPNFSGDPFVSIIMKNKEVHRSKPIKVPKGATSYDIPVDHPIYGDVKIQLAVSKGRSVQNMCHFWFNTGFIDSSNKLVLEKHEVDVANKDKKCSHFKADFKLEAIFEAIEVDSVDPNTKKIVEETKEQSKNIKLKPTANDESSSEEEEEKKKTEDKKASAAVSFDAKSSKKKDSKDSKSSEPFVKRRKRAQSFYDGEDEDEENDDLSESEREQKVLEKYFEEEEIEASTGSENGRPLKESNKKKLNVSITTSPRSEKNDDAEASDDSKKEAKDSKSDVSEDGSSAPSKNSSAETKKSDKEESEDDESEDAKKGDEKVEDEKKKDTEDGKKEEIGSDEEKKKEASAEVENSKDKEKGSKKDKKQKKESSSSSKSSKKDKQSKSEKSSKTDKKKSKSKSKDNDDA